LTQGVRSLLTRSPFVLGFLFAAGALVAIQLGEAIAALSTVWVLIVVSLFLAIGLNPLVERLTRQGLRRGQAVAVVFLLALAAFAGILVAIVPPLVEQVTALVGSIPELATQLQENELVRRLDEQFGVVDQLQKVNGAELASSAFGGLLGFGIAVVSGLFTVITVLVLTLYFLGSLPSITAGFYRLVPASRRARVQDLGDRVVTNVGGFVAGQSTVAVTAGVAAYLFLFVLGKVMDAPLIGRYSLALALVVAVFDIIPLIGAMIGAAVVVTVGLADSPSVAIVLAVYFAIYQQVENYLIAPRIMRRSVDIAPMVTILAALVGGTLLGVVGALVAIPIAAGVLMVVREVVLPRMETS